MPKVHHERFSGSFHALEARTLFANAFVGVGLAVSEEVPNGYDAWSYVIEGSVDVANGDLSGGVEAFGSGNPISASSLNGRKAVDLGYGRMRVLDGTWLRPGVSGVESGESSFLSDLGYPVGFSINGYASGLVAGDAVLLAQRPTSASLADLWGEWRMSVLSESGGNPVISEGRVQVNGDVIGFQASLPFAGYGFGLHVDAVDGDGEVRVSHWETRAAAPTQRFYLSADKSFALYVNTGAGTSDSSIGVMYRMDSSVGEADLVGTYRVGMGWSYDRATIQGVFGSTPDGVGEGARQIWTVPTALVLGADHTYRFYSLDDFDRGLKGSSLVSGAWSLDQGEITLSMNGSPALKFAVGAGGHSIFAGKSVGALSVLGVGTRLFPARVSQQVERAELAHAVVRDSHAIVFERGDDNFWREFHVEQAFPGTPDDIAEADAWVDAKGTGIGDTWAVASSVSGTFVFHRASGGAWTSTNISQAAASAPIVDQLQVVEAADGAVHLMGKASDGDLVRYSRGDDGSSWTFHNITEEIVSTGQSMPTLQGDLTSYATKWGALNVVGLDGSGRAWAIWWAPGLANWQASDLSAATGQDARFSGGLTVYLTPWDGINIAGVDANGSVDAVWWTPDLKGQWRRDSISGATGVSEADRPRLAPRTVTSYTTAWGGLNIAGVDSRTNQVVQYWWSPQANAWAIASISAAIGRMRSAVIESLRGYAASDGSMNLVAEYEPGDYDDGYQDSIPSYQAGYSNSYNAGSNLMSMQFSSSYGIGSPWGGTTMSGIGDWD